MLAGDDVPSLLLYAVISHRVGGVPAREKVPRHRLAKKGRTPQENKFV
jgi:hypothetical protein